MSSKLFTPVRVGSLNLQHRVAMAPLTRFRADINGVHSSGLAAQYYEQRASVPGTLLVTEATFISPRAVGYDNVPGLYTEDQIAAWRKVTDRVHTKGSYIFAQLWAHGRVAVPAVREKHGGDVAGPSAIAMGPEATVPRELTEEEIQAFIQDFAQAAKNAVAAGFDGVEIHGANGYLVDQFIQDVSNQRTDRWGGSIENRSRFAVEVVKAAVDAIGADKVAIRLSPWNDFQGMKMKDPIAQFTHLVRELRQLNLAYLHFVASREAGEGLEFALEAWNNASPVIIASGFESETVREAVDEEYKKWDVIIAFGRHFIANPDLVYRIREGLELNQYNRATFYSPEDPAGYIDYPFHSKFEQLRKTVIATEDLDALTKVTTSSAVAVAA